MTTTKAEQETIIRWDQEQRVLHLYTANASEARKWKRLGFAVEVCGRTQAGEARGWQAPAPLAAIRLRKLVDGNVVRRRRGRSFGSRKLATKEHQSRSVGRQGQRDRDIAGEAAKLAHPND